MADEPTFFPDPAVDRVMGVVLAMATELYVTRDRLRELENLLVKSGHLDRAQLDAAPADDAARRKDAEEFVRGLLAPLLATPAAGTPDPWK